MRDVIRLLAALTALHQGATGFAFTPPTFHSPLCHPSCSYSQRQPHQFSSRSSCSLNEPWRQRITRHEASADKELASERKTTNNKISTSSSTNNTIITDGVGSVVISAVDEAEDYVVAIKRTMVWVAAAAAFGGALSVLDSPTTSEEFFAGYLLEQSLSVDNLLVFLLLFEYFKIPPAYQNRILNWGIIGAIFMRAIMIGAGAVAIQHFHAVLLVFAAVLIFSSAKVLLGSDDDEEEDFSQNIVVRFSDNFIKSTSKFDGDRFFTEVDGVRLATPMFLCMVAVELSDVIFAVDSIPAVFGVTENPIVVFSSNMFAILGLRSLYTILSKAASELKYLEPAVAIVLGFIGSKMVGEFMGYSVPTELSLAVVATLLSGGVVASILDKTEENVTAMSETEQQEDESIG